MRALWRGKLPSAYQLWPDGFPDTGCSRSLQPQKRPSASSAILGGTDERGEEAFVSRWRDERILIVIGIDTLSAGTASVAGAARVTGAAGVVGVGDDVGAACSHH